MSDHDPDNTTAFDDDDTLPEGAWRSGSDGAIDLHNRDSRPTLPYLEVHDLAD